MPKPSDENSRVVRPDARLTGINLEDLHQTGFISPPIMNPEEALQVKEARERIECGLKNSLSPRDEKVVRMCLMGNVTLKEAARIFGVSQSAVYQIIRRAKAKLWRSAPIRAAKQTILS